MPTVYRASGCFKEGSINERDVVGDNGRYSCVVGAVGARNVWRCDTQHRTLSPFLCDHMQCLIITQLCLQCAWCLYLLAQCVNGHVAVDRWMCVCRYFSLQALEPLGMGDEVRVEIELGICSESGARHDTFATAQLMAYNKMNEAWGMHNIYSHIGKEIPYILAKVTVVHLLEFPLL